MSDNSPASSFDDLDNILKGNFDWVRGISDTGPSRTKASAIADRELILRNTSRQSLSRNISRKPTLKDCDVSDLRTGSATDADLEKTILEIKRAAACRRVLRRVRSSPGTRLEWREVLECSSIGAFPSLLSSTIRSPVGAHSGAVFKTFSPEEQQLALSFGCMPPPWDDDVEEN